MLRRVTATILALLLTIALLPTRPAQAAETPSLAFRFIQYPAAIKAGETITFRVQAAAVGGDQLCCGELYLKGPGGQRHIVRLLLVSDGMLEGKLALPPNTQEGTWEIAELWLAATESAGLTLDKTTNFVHSFNVTSSGQPADTKPPVLIGVQLPEEVTAGEIFPVTARAADDLSGVDRIYVTLRPQDNAPGADEPFWRYTVELRPLADKPSEFVGYTVADPLVLSSQVQEIASVRLYDKTGNNTTYDPVRLAPNTNNKTTSRLKQREVPEALITSPYLKVIHPGEVGYWFWLDQDRLHMQSLLQESATDPTAVREKIAAELPQLRATLEELRKEVYVDPVSQVKVSPYATTGKWLALDAAIWARIAMLSELDRLQGLTQPELTPLTPGIVDAIYTVAGEGETLLPVENVLNELSAQLPASVLTVLAKSPEAVAALKSPAWESTGYGYYDLFDRDVLYFSPVYSRERSYLRWSQASMVIPINPGQPVSGVVMDLFYDIGQHFGQAHLSSFDAADAAQRWGEYLGKRNAEPFQLGAGPTSPENNLGDDFAWTFLPGGLSDQYRSLQSLPRLRENPEMAKVFREWVAQKLQSPAPVTTITPSSFLEVGTSATFKATLAPYSAAQSFHSQGFRWSPILKESIRAVQTGDLAEYSASAATVGRISWYLMQAKDSTGRTYARVMYYFRSPVLLDPMPTATNQPTMVIAGQAPPNQKVMIGDASAFSGKDGKFRLTIPLKEGANDLRLTVSGQSLGARFTVTYEPARKPVSLRVELPGSTRESQVFGMIYTEPFAMVAVKGLKGQADAKGQTPFYIPVAEGVNTVEVVATTPAGNSATWKGVVLRDSEAAEIQVNLPVLTNQQNFTVTGSVEAGSTLTINDAIVPVDGTGAFKQSLVLKEGANTLKMVATDRSGNRTEQTAAITYSPAVPTVATRSVATLKGKVAPGTSLSYQGQKVLVGLDGSFTYDVPLNLGANTVVLSASLNGQSTGFLQFEVMLPVKADAPTTLPDGRLSMTGKTLPGYLIAVNDMLVPVEPDGSFLATFDKKGLVAVITVIGEGKTYKVEVPTP